MSESDSGPTSDTHFGRELPNGKEPRGWITEAEWTISINEQFQHPMDRLRSASDVSIFRVPNVLMKESKNGEAYIPQRVSLGPYHHRNAKLRPMESHKGRALNRMVMRFNKNRDFANDSTNMEFFVHAKQKIWQLENEIKKSYEEEISCNGETLGLMLSLDGCFILEILRTMDWEFDQPSKASKCYEPIFKRIKINYTGGDILEDIFKLENQIPLIVLQKLLELELNSTDVKKNLFDLMYNLVERIYPFNYENVDMNKFLKERAHEVDHLLGFSHRMIVSPPSHDGERVGDDTSLPHQDDGTNGEDQDQHSAVNGEDRDQNGGESNIHRAVELGNAGIKFKGGSGGIKEISFDPKSATISLPAITIKELTEVLLRNLIALEMCNPSRTNYVACYVCLMDQLIDSEADVAFLRKNGIVKNGLGSDKEVAKLFNGLCKGVTVSLEGVFNNLTKEVNKHYTNKFKVQCAEFVKENFSSVWKTLASAAAIFIMVLTVVQTIFSILSVYK